MILSQKTLIVGNGAGSQQDSPLTTRLRLSPDAVALCQVRSNSFEEVNPHHNLGMVTNAAVKRIRSCFSSCFFGWAS